MKKIGLKTYAIAVGVIQLNGKILVAKRTKTKKFAPGKWEIPSGFIADHESAENTILREIKEELGMNSQIEMKLSSYEFTDDEARWVVIPFSLQLLDDSIKINHKDYQEFKWLPLKEALQHLDLQIFYQAFDAIRNKK